MDEKKLCRHCKMEIPKAAKVCPYCRKGQGGMGGVFKTIILAVFGFLAFIFIVSIISTIFKAGSSKSESAIVAANERASFAESVAESMADSPLANASDVNYEITDTNFSFEPKSYAEGCTYYGIVEITNTGNTNLYLKSATFDIEDSSGSLVNTESFISTCPDVIAPGEKGYFYNSIGISVEVTEQEMSTYQFVPTVKAEKSNSSPVEYEVSDISISKDSLMGYPKVTGRVRNTTENDDSILYIQVVYFDASGHVIEIDGTNITDFAAGTQQSFEISSIFSNVSYDDIADYKVVARKAVMQF